MPVENHKYSYTSYSQNATNPASKYRNEYTATSTYRPSNPYTKLFDDIVSSGAFSSNLYSTSRYLERSRSRSRERSNAMRSPRSASNYYQAATNFPAPIRRRDYSTPPTQSSGLSRSSSRSGSFMSFMDYSNSKRYELQRNSSRSSAYDSGLTRSA